MTTKCWKKIALLAVLTILAASPAAFADDPIAYFKKIAGQLAACYQQDGTLPKTFDETSNCWTLTPVTGPGFSATMREYERQGSDPNAGDYWGWAQFQSGDKTCTFSLSFDYSGEDILGRTSNLNCSGS